jgi:hypothetical protein
MIAGFCFLVAAACGPAQTISNEGVEAAQMSAAFIAEVDRRLEIPEQELKYYGELIRTAGVEPDIRAAQYVVIIDRNEFVQTAMIWLLSSNAEAYFIGASPVSTGRTGSFDHFKTPTGIFEHTIDNLDFRALGTRNEMGIRGYGRRGMRVFDFGWQTAEKGWGRGGPGIMRLQMHATDPDLLERRLGSVQSKGCIRISASLNTFIDSRGILDAAYEEALAAGRTFWVLSKVRVSTSYAGRYLLVVDSERADRPVWSPDPLHARLNSGAASQY